MDVELILMDNKDPETQLTLKHSLKELKMLKKLAVQTVQPGI